LREGQLGPNDPVAVRVLADGRCLFYCLQAMRGAARWLKSHDEKGRPSSEAQAIAERNAAEDFRIDLVAFARSKGMEATATRLSSSGSRGFPGLDDIDLVAAMMGGAFVVQAGDVQILKGTGPVLAHLRSCVVRDGANRPSEHWELYQSYLTPFDDPEDVHAGDGILAGEICGDHPADPATLMDDGDISDAELPEDLVKRISVPGGVQSDQAFHELFDELQSNIADDVDAQSDHRQVEDTLVESSRKTWRMVERKHPSWHRDLVHLAVAAMLVFSLRVEDVFIREHVLFLHVILGMGDEQLRSHDGMTFAWDPKQGAWSLYAGLLPAHVYSRLKRFLLCLEGLFRCIRGSRKSDPEEVLRVVCNAFESVGPGVQSHAAIIQHLYNEARYAPARARPARGSAAGRNTSGPPHETDGRDSAIGLETDLDNDVEVVVDSSAPWYIQVAQGVRQIGRLPPLSQWSHFAKSGDIIPSPDNPRSPRLQRGSSMPFIPGRGHRT
jgi:hypothetical protein